MKLILYAVTAMSFNWYLQYRSIIISILIFAGLVFVHEAGHFLIAKCMKLPVRTFSIGIGPKLFSFKWNETDICFSLLPFGGYVQLLEEDGATDVDTTSWRYLLLYSGGIIANIILAIIILSGLYIDQSRIITKELVQSPLLIASTRKISTDRDASLQSGDMIYSLDNLKFPGNTIQSLVEYIKDKPGKTVSLLIKRNGVYKKINIILRNELGNGKLDVIFADENFRYHRRKIQINDVMIGCKLALQHSIELVISILSGLWQIFTGKANIRSIGGPIAIIHISSIVVKRGLVELLNFISVMSIQLAILNVLPIPILDGGRIAILLFEKLCKRSISNNTKNRLFILGFTLMICIAIIVTIFDIMRLLH